ncbi:MAG: PQQ-binding-like beta-propeller repeat protein [Rhodothermales bacterium]
MLQLSAPLRVQDGDWTTEGGSNARANATEQTLALPLDEVWDYDADGAFGPAAAVVADDVVIVVTRKGEVRVLGLEDGRKRGSVDLREPIEGAPVVTNRMLYAPVAAGKRTIVALDFVDGRRVWSLRVGPHDAGLLLDNNTLVAAGRDGTVRGIDPADGTARWQTTPDSLASFFATPVALHDAVIVADDRGRVTTLDLATGAVRWTRELGIPVYASPAVHGGRLFVPTTRGRFVTLDAATGEPGWSAEAESDEVRFSAPAVDDALVVVGASDGRLRAFDPATGRAVWTFLADGNFAAAPLLAGDVVFAGSLDEHVYAFDRATGDVLWQHELDGRVKSTPIVHGDRLIVLAEPRHVHVFAPASPVAASNE